MKLSETDKTIKKNMRKELRQSLGDTLGELMVEADFDSLTQQLWVLDDVSTRISHQIRSRVQKEILQRSPRYPALLESMRDKERDREQIAKEIKAVLKEQGYEESDITDERDRRLARTPVYQLMSVSKGSTEKVLLGVLLKNPLWSKYLQKVRGISVLTASKLMYLVGDVTRFSQPSKLIKYCGLATGENGVDRLKRGEEASYKPELKSLVLGVIAPNMLKSDSQYRVVYDERRRKTAEGRLDWGVNPKTKKEGYKAHFHADAQRVMGKRFVVEFWKAGWLAAGKEVPTKPYPVAILGHDEEPDIVPYG